MIDVTHNIFWDYISSFKTLIIYYLISKLITKNRKMLTPSNKGHNYYISQPNRAIEIRGKNKQKAPYQKPWIIIVTLLNVDPNQAGPLPKSNQ